MNPSMPFKVKWLAAKPIKVKELYPRTLFHQLSHQKRKEKKKS